MTFYALNVGWHTSGVRNIFIVCPVVSLRSTTGYRLISLRLGESQTQEV